MAEGRVLGPAWVRISMTLSARPTSSAPPRGPFDRRRSGVLLHPTSLPGGHHVGDLGPEARRFAVQLAHAQQTYWQMLPVCPTGPTPSPYDSPSASALNPLLISLEDLADDGLISFDALSIPQTLENRRHAALVDAAALKQRALEGAHRALRTGRRPDLAHEFEDFLNRESSWLEDHALFEALRHHLDRSWVDWEPSLRDREPGALTRARRQLRQEIDFHRFVQFLLDRQWKALREHCAHHKISLMGDVPIYVAHDSVDVWAHREVFCLDADGRRRVVAGVPPDYFCADGQLWGNPLYRWSHLEETGFAWWIGRFRVALSRFDCLRLDHFVGFVRYWEVPGHAATAKEGRYLQVPGERFLETVLGDLGFQPFLAEDLGVVTEEVHALRHRFALPGMRILLFAFDDPNGSDYLPHRYERNTAVYTGTHDNDTAIGWFTMPAPSPEQAAWHAACRARALRYLGTDGHRFHWDLIRAAFQSVANTAIVPVQDLLGLSSDARMNVPGTVANNWLFRLTPGELKDTVLGELAGLTSATERER